MNEEAAKIKEINPWGSSLDKFKEWDPKGAGLLSRVGANPWNNGVLPRKEVELISLALYSACTTRPSADCGDHFRNPRRIERCVVWSSEWVRVQTVEDWNGIRPSRSRSVQRNGPY